MKLIDLQIRTTDLLSYLDNDDSETEMKHSQDRGRFREAIAEINKQKPEDESGFSDVVAKVTVLYIALTALLKDNYLQNIKDPRTKLMAHLIFNDETSSEDILEADLTELQNPNTKDNILKDRLNQFNQFLRAANQLKPLYKKRHQENAILLKEFASDDEVFYDIDHDVDQEEEKTLKLSNKLALGTSGLGPCVAIFVFGENDKNEKYVTLGHYSSPTQEIIQQMIRSLHETKNCNPTSSKVYLLGGSIYYFVENALLLLNPDLPIMDVRLCMNNNSFDQTSKVAIKGKNPLIAHSTEFVTMMSAIKIPGVEKPIYVPNPQGFFKSSAKCLPPPPKKNEAPKNAKKTL